MGSYGNDIANSIALNWDKPRSNRVRLKMHRRKEIRVVRKSGAAAVAGAAGLWLALHVALGSGTSGTTAHTSNPKAAVTIHPARFSPGTAILSPATVNPEVKPTLTMADGSTIVALGRSSALHVVHETREESLVQLEQGKARFAVAKNSDRIFRVQTGNVAVRVLGTVFSVDRADAQVRIDVARGVVEVTSTKGVTILSAGDSLTVQDTSHEAPETVEVPPIRQQLPALNSHDAKTHARKDASKPK